MATIGSLANVCFKVGNAYRSVGCIDGNKFNKYECASAGCSCNPTPVTLNNGCDTNTNTKFQTQCAQSPGTSAPTKVVYADDDTECKNPASYVGYLSSLCFSDSRLMFNCSLTEGFSQYVYPSGCSGQAVRSVNYAGNRYLI